MCTDTNNQPTAARSALALMQFSEKTANSFSGIGLSLMQNIRIGEVLSHIDIPTTWLSFYKLKWEGIYTKVSSIRGCPSLL